MEPDMPEWLKPIFSMVEHYTILLKPSSKTREELCKELLDSRYDLAVQEGFPKDWQMLAGLTGKLLADGNELALVMIGHSDKITKEKESWLKYYGEQPVYVKP